VDYKKLDDQTLVRLMARSDEGALSELYDRYGRLVYSMALNSLGDPALAEEVSQDVFYRVWKNAVSYDAVQGKVSTWLVSIARNRAIDEVRRMQVRPESNQIPWELAGFDQIGDPIDVEAEFDQSQRQGRVRMAVAQLPDDQRTVLAFAYFQGLSHREIAELLNEPLGTIKTRIRLAMKKLSGLLEE
jgi:RNA polymerase sigma-70 factor (ECF subfamily)